MWQEGSVLMERASLNTPTTTFNNLENVLEVVDIYKILGVLEICVLFLPDFQPDAQGNVHQLRAAFSYPEMGPGPAGGHGPRIAPLSDLFTPPSAAGLEQLNSSQHSGTDCMPPCCVNYATNHTVTVRLGAHALGSAHLALSQHLHIDNCVILGSSPRPLSLPQVPLL